MFIDWSYFLLSLSIGFFYVCIFLSDNKYIKKYKKHLLLVVILVMLLAPIYLSGINRLIVTSLELLVGFSMFLMFVFFFHIRISKLVVYLLASLLFGVIAILNKFNGISDFLFQYSTIFLVAIFIKSLIYEAIFEK